MKKLDLETWSQHQQDLFAYFLLETDCFLVKPSTKRFLDIGCREIESSNTYKLERLGWNGLLFDSDPRWHGFNVECRRSEFFSVDATTDEFCDVFMDNPEYLDVDYVSLDVDEDGFRALDNLLKVGVRFKCITFEHDRCSNGSEIKSASNRLFKEHGYELLFDDVGCDGRDYEKYEGPWGDWGENAPIEDWWVDPTAFNQDVMNLSGVGETHFRIIEKLFKTVCITYLNKSSGVGIENNGVYHGGAVEETESVLSKFKVEIANEI